MKQEIPQKETILAAAVAKGMELLPFNEANERIVALHQQVGDLECAIGLLKEAVKTLKTQKKALENRNAALEDGIKAISAHCSWRELGFCDVLCSGRSFCKTDGLEALPLSLESGEASSQ